METKILIRPDGTFSVLCGGSEVLRDCAPLVSGRPLHPLQVRTDNDSILYETAYGRLTLRFSSSENEVRIGASFSGWTRKLHWFSAFSGILAPQARGIYQSSGRIGAACGFVPLDNITSTQMVRGQGVCAVSMSKGQALILRVEDHTNYHQEFQAVRRVSDPDYCELGAAFRLEEVNGAEQALPDVILSASSGLEEGLRAAAGAIGAFMNARHVFPPAYHWCSWYYNGYKFSEQNLQEYVRGFAAAPSGRDIRYFQIDAGYFGDVGDWLEPCEGTFPSGIEKACRTVTEAGFVPGIWVAPFMAGCRSKVVKDHEDWILHNRSGERIVGISADKEQLWGYPDEEYYLLDASHPQVMDYLRHVFRELYRYGFRMFKTDFMLWGYQDSAEVRRYTPGRTSVSYYRDVLKMIREEIRESYWLGCIAPFYPFIGYADAMRIGSDVGPSWKGRFGPQNMLMTVSGNAFWNFSYYQTDPDATFVRDFQIQLSDTEIRSLALYSAMSGGCIYTSDPIHKLSPERARLWAFIRPEKQAVPHQPYLDQVRPDKVMIHYGPHQSLLFVFNISDDELLQEYPLEDLGFGPEVFLTGEDDAVSRESGRIILRIPPHDHKLFVVSTGQAAAFDHENLWNNLG